MTREHLSTFGTDRVFLTNIYVPQLVEPTYFQGYENRQEEITLCRVRVGNYRKNLEEDLWRKPSCILGVGSGPTARWPEVCKGVRREGSLCSPVLGTLASRSALRTSLRQKIGLDQVGYGSHKEVPLVTRSLFFAIKQA